MEVLVRPDFCGLYVINKQKKISIIVQKWSNMQAAVFDTNPAPFYGLVDYDDEILVLTKAIKYRNLALFVRSGIEA